jgi:hypothetical protein
MAALRAHGIGTLADLAVRSLNRFRFSQASRRTALASGYPRRDDNCHVAWINGVT